MTLALYRKYRPATFADVVGQEHVTDPLRKALAAGRINHAYLFSGPRGCGKTSSARILARSLNCVNGPTPDPCGECAPCLALAPEGPGSLDVVELDAASHGGVDDTRELRDRAFYMPSESRYRVFIIDEAHMVSNQGFNALLKIVEEPPEHVVFVFATTEPEKVLPTIRSRTHHYPFHLLPPTVLRGLLEKLCGEEGVAVEPAVYPLVVRAGAGSARDALSVMDQLLAGAGQEGVTYASAVALLGVTDAALLDQMVDALAAADGESVFGAIELVAQAGHDPRRFGADLLQRLRDLVILQAVPDAAEKGLVDEPADQLAAMVAQAGRLPVATLTRFAEVLHSGLSEMRGTTSPRLVLELLAARMLLPAASLDDAGLLQRLERVERRLDIALDGDGGGPAALGSREADSGSAAAERMTAADRGDSRLAGARADAGAPRTGRSSAPAAARGSAPDADRDGGAAAASAAPESDAKAPEGVDLGLPTPPVLSSLTKSPAKPSAGTATEAQRGAGERAATSVSAGAADEEAAVVGAGQATGGRSAGAPDAGDGAAARVAADGPAKAASVAKARQAIADDEAATPRADAPAADGAAAAPGTGTDDAVQPETPPKPEQEPAAPGTGADVGVNDVRRLWPQVLEMIKGRNRRTHALLESAAVTVVGTDGGVLQLTSKFPALARMISETSNADLVRDALRELLGVDWRVRCSEEGAGSGPGDTFRSSAPAGQPRTSDAAQERSAAQAAPRATSGRAGGSRAGGVQADEAPADAEPDRSSSDSSASSAAGTGAATDEDAAAAGWGAERNTAHAAVTGADAAMGNVEHAVVTSGAAAQTTAGRPGSQPSARAAAEYPRSPRETPDPPPEDEYDPYSEIDPEADPGDASSYQVIDPSRQAIDLLAAKLGARPVDGQTLR